MDDDFEYHLKLPSSPYSDASKHSKADLNTTPTDCIKEPVVILLGWMGCNYKHLSKYSEFYEAKGCVTISYIAATSTILFSPAKAKEHAQKILQLLIDFSYEDNPIFFHIFSNGGSIIYQHVCSLLGNAAEFKHLKVCGSVFDSAPGKPRPINAIKSILIVFQHWNIIFRLFAALFLFIYLHFTVIKHKIYTYFMGPDHGDVYSFLKNDSKHLMPQLYLYSSVDKIIPSDDIEQLIKFREESLGVKIFKHKWTDSSHVKHFVSHRETYINTCYSFLDTCLKKLIQ
ncbi:transmembrane protein 53 [Octopus bimaculoides]|uniref:Transmembrane protein 53 n=1 Tax=Octopus bimaculoides TaxID=37653 RepID=A0A0L8GWT2_OCTBM|nr:transmembrane protein 53 [Octopus bimaculoides]|eukprot:XP_014777652.1 PREDICTED: transmembrane protein 53-like [Octopus bimaculoides]